MTPLPNNVIEGICQSSHGMEGSSHDYLNNENDDANFNLLCESDRLRTFSNWTAPFTNIRDLAAAGFYYVNYMNRGDLVKCPYCNLEVSNLEEGADPFEVHRRSSPHCIFMQQKFKNDGLYCVSGFDTCGGILGNKRISISDAELKARECALKELRINTGETPSFPKYASYEERLKSYDRWPVTFKLRPNVISEAGFYYAGNGVRSICFHCGGCVSWMENDDPFEEHAHWFPNCHFIKSYIARKNEEKSHIAFKSGYSCPPPRRSPSRSLHYDLESDRLKTFDNWPVPFIDKNELAEAGFVYTQYSDRVSCFYCNVELCNWEVGDDPASEHLKHSPNCSHALHCRAMLQRKAGGSQVQANSEPVNGYDTCGPYDVVNKRPAAYPRYTTFESRVNSFRNWPTTSKIRPSTLWEAGFFYTGNRDHTICHQCGGGLKDWKEQDDPWIEHAHWFPQCQYVLSTKGSAFIYEARLKKRETLALTQEEMKTAVDTLKNLIRTSMNPPDVNIGNANENEGCAINERSASVESHDDEKSRLLCKICLLENWNTLFYQCGHMACSKCAKAIDKCAFCRKPILDRVQMYCS